MQSLYRIRWIVIIICGAVSLLALNALVRKLPFAFYEIQQHAARSMDWVLKDVVVEGRQRTGISDILKAIQTQMYTPLLNYSPLQMKENLEKLPWVYSALVRREWPHTLYIKLQERQPIAIFQTPTLYKGVPKLIDQHGTIIQTTHTAVEEEFLMITGEGAPPHVPRLLKLLSQFPDIYERTTSAIWLARRWDLILDGRIRLKLPETHIKEALQFVLNLHHNYKLLDDKVISIDVRLGDRSYIQFEKDKGIVT